MAKIQGKEKKSFQRNLFVGVANLVPIAFNPTNEQLMLVTRGAKNFENPIKYTFTDPQGSTSYKLDMWCKLVYTTDESGNIFQHKNLINDETANVEYICYSFWARDKKDIINNDDGSVKGVWYVNTNSCEMEWVPGGDVAAHTAARKGKTRLDFNDAKTHIAMQGEKDLLTLLERWLYIQEIDLETPFIKIAKGDVKEINSIIKDNLQREDRDPRGFKALLGIKETEDASYQSVYSMPMSEDTTNYNRLRDALDKRAWKDNKTSNGDFTLRKYNPSMPQENTVIDRPKPSSSGW